MTVSFSRTLRYRLPMMNGDDVRLLQTNLFQRGYGQQVDIDGLFGPGTRDRVTAFQRDRALSVDGVAGPEVFEALNDAAGSPAPAPVTPAPVAPPPALASGRLIPADWMPPAQMKRIILHWTAGSWTPSANEKTHYHILIDGDGKAHKGLHGINDNVPPLNSGRYAAHTRGTNSHSIGLTVCAMLNAHETPFDAGPFPMKPVQWEALARAAAELCLRYGIPVGRTTVLGHGEVQDLLGRPQTGKWDPMALPWDPGLPFRTVGDRMRARVSQLLEALKNPAASPDEPETLPDEPVTVDGTAIPGTRFDGRNWIDLTRLAEHLGWSAPFVDGAAADIEAPPLRIAVEQAADATGTLRIWAEVSEISQKAGMALDENPDGSLRLKSLTPEGPGAPRRVVVRRGQTLVQIARRWLGEAGRWRELRDETGRPFDEDSARSLRVGQVVLLPDGQDAPPAPAAATPAGPALSDARIRAAARAIAATAPSFVGASGRETMRKSAQEILKTCKTLAVRDAAHRAYILATANHETNLGRKLVEIWGPTEIQKKYVGKLGNATLAEAKRYRGRGFVQITGKSNYERYGTLLGQDFVADPDRVADRVLAAEILVRGMTEFGFTSPGFVLSDIGSDGDFDFVRARELINGDKNRTGDSRYPGQTIGLGIAGIALKYLEIIDSA